MPAGPRPHPCPVVARGVHLREACAECRGRPSLGQRRLSRGEVLYWQDDPAERVFAVVSGWLRQHHLTAEGQHAGARLVPPGSVVGLEALRGGRYGATVDVLRAAEVCTLPRARVTAWLADHPDDALGLISATAEDLTRLQGQVARNHALPAEDRVRAMIEELAARGRPGEWFELPTTREELGELLGLTLETVSRMIQRLRRAGIIDVHGRKVRLLARGD